MSAEIFESSGSTSLHKAAAHPIELRRLEELLKSDAVEVNQQSWCGETPLHVICLSKCVDGVKEAVHLLLQNGANVNMRDKQGRTPLLCATMKGNWDVVATLLSSGHADPDQSDIFGQNPINEAASADHWRIVESLLQAGASVITTSRYKETPVHLAAQCGQSRCLEKLLQVAVENGQKEIIDLCSGFGFTPLMQASWNGRVECVEILLKFGANPNLKIEERSFCSALHVAIYANHAECIKLLVDKMDLQHLVHCADISTDYVCPLQAAIERRNHDALRRLLSLGFPVDNVHNVYRYKRTYVLPLIRAYIEPLPRCQTSLSFAASVEDIDSMKILLDYGASVNPVLYDIVNNNGVHQKLSLAPVLSALCCRSWKAFDLLMEHCCNVSFPQDGICLSKCLLLSFCKYDCAKKLLIFGADPHLIFHQENNNYETILSYLGDIFRKVGYKAFFNILELLLEFMVISQPVQCFFYDIFKLCQQLFPKLGAYEWYNEKWNAILKKVDKPSSLKNLCRLDVRRVMIPARGYSSFRAAVDHLYLPKILKEYLLYSEMNGKRACFV